MCVNCTLTSDSIKWSQHKYGVLLIDLPILVIVWYFLIPISLQMQSKIQLRKYENTLHQPLLCNSSVVNKGFGLEEPMKVVDI